MVIKITFRYLILYILLTHSFPQLEGRSKGKGSTDIRLGLRYHIKIGEHFKTEFSFHAALWCVLVWYIYLPLLPEHLLFAFLTMKTNFDLEVWSCLVAIHTVLTHLTEHLVAKIYCWKMLRRGQFFRDIIYQCLTWPTPNIHSLLPLSINCNTAGREGGDVTQNSGPPISHRAGVGAFQINKHN